MRCEKEHKAKGAMWDLGLRIADLAKAKGIAQRAPVKYATLSLM